MFGHPIVLKKKAYKPGTKSRKYMQCTWSLCYTYLYFDSNTNLELNCVLIGAYFAAQEDLEIRSDDECKENKV